MPRAIQLSLKRLSRGVKQRGGGAERCSEGPRRSAVTLWWKRWQELP